VSGDVLPWHKPVLDKLQQRAVDGTLPAAIALICGEGWGGNELIERAAFSLLNLTSKQPPHEIAHPDFCWVAPDGAVIKIDQVRKLNAFAVNTPQIAKCKVAVIVDAHLLNTNAANTLLKTLEEPPRNTHILLSTPHWGRLLPTIRSRCQRYQVAQSADEATQWLSANGNDISGQAFAQSGYAPLHAQQEKRFDLDAWLSELESSRDPSTSITSILESDLVDVLARWYRGLIWQQREKANRTLLAFADELNQTRLQLETSNAANPKLLIERLVYQWLQVVRLQRQRGA
tara:strand:- start:1070 stop:1933 length:864 start_codon:yes stop_codon:yes gene_type:complete